MKSLGITRKVDELGRIVLPKELRDTMDILLGTPIEIYVDGETIILKKYEPACIFCGNARNVNIYKNKKVCQDCLNDLKSNMYMQGQL